MLAGSGLRGTELRIDCTVSDGSLLPSTCVTYTEAKFTLILVSASDQPEGVGQLWVSIPSTYAAVDTPEVTSRCMTSA